MKYTVLAYDTDRGMNSINEVEIRNIQSQSEFGAIGQAKEAVSRSYYRVVDVSF